MVRRLPQAGVRNAAPLSVPRSWPRFGGAFFQAPRRPDLRDSVGPERQSEKFGKAKRLCT